MDTYEITNNIPYKTTAKVERKRGRKNRHKSLEIEKMTPGQSVCLEKLHYTTRSAAHKVKLHENSIKLLLKDRGITNLNYKVDFYTNRRVRQIRLWILDSIT
jgi:hypothetical protein